MAEVWVAAVASAVVGAGATMYGANKQAKANSAAQAANMSAQDRQNSAAWGSYLMTRGIAPTQELAPGVLPTEGQYKVTNARLPLWMTVKSPPTTRRQTGGFLVPRAA